MGSAGFRRIWWQNFKKPFHIPSKITWCGCYMVNDVWSVKRAFVFCSVFLNSSEIFLIPRKNKDIMVFRYQRKQNA